MIVKLLTKHHLEFLSLKGSYTCSSESTLVKMPHCWKSHVTAQIILICKSCTESHKLSLRNRIYVFIHCSMITEVAKHFKNVLQQVKWLQVFRLCCILIISVD